MTPAASLPALVDSARAGQHRAIGRLLSLVEDGRPQVRELMELLTPHGGHAQIVGLTGAPGVGKSTTTSALVRLWRERGLRVAVLAVDPSSPFSQGALLGDRIRMSEHAGDPGVFIRSMATRGHLGGLSLAAPQAIRVLDAAGFDLVIVETVGVGQSEVEIVDRADTTLVLLAPGMGDGVQAVKAGILEIGDIFVVNKADRFGADATVRDLRHMISLADRSAPGNWRPRVHSTVAERSEGLEELADSIRDHWRWLGESGALARRRATRAAQEITALVLEQLRARMEHSAPERALTQLAQEVAMGRLGPHAAADLLRSEIASE